MTFKIGQYIYTKTLGMVKVIDRLDNDILVVTTNFTLDHYELDYEDIFFVDIIREHVRHAP